MKQNEIVVGDTYAVEFARDEADMGFGHSRALVKATALERTEGDSWGYRSRPVKGVRFRLEERLRVQVRGDEPFEELPAGFEFFAESRLVQRRWGAMARGVDERRFAEREQRYIQQDEIRERMARYGFTSGFELRAGEMVVQNGVMAELLRRIDPVSIAEDAVREVFAVGGPVEDFDDVVGGVIEEIRQGLAVRDADISGEG